MKMKYKDRYLPFTGKRAKILRQMLENAKVPDRSVLEKQAEEARVAIASYLAKIRSGEENGTVNR